MFEPGVGEFWAATKCDGCGKRRAGGHYNLFGLRENDDFRGMEALRSFFDGGTDYSMNFVLFSTSGVHGCYRTIEDIEASLRKYPDGVEAGHEPDDWVGPSITFLVVQPRIVALRYGNADVTLDDIPFLKEIRAKSHAAIALIGEA